MIVDLRAPAIVIAGNFNPAIFTPEWIALALYEIPQGEEVGGIFVTDVVQQATRPYINRIAVTADMERLSIFCDEMTDASISRAEAIACKVAEVLPHTPVGGVGLNFQFVIADPDVRIVDMLQPEDRPERLGPVRTNELQSQIELGDGVLLNLARRLEAGVLRVRFNFHSDIQNMHDVQARTSGKFRSYYDKSKAALAEMYGVDIDDVEFQTALNN